MLVGQLQEAFIQLRILDAGEADCNVNIQGLIRSM